MNLDELIEQRDNLVAQSQEILAPYAPLDGSAPAAILPASVRAAHDRLRRHIDSVNRRIAVAQAQQPNPITVIYE